MGASIQQIIGKVNPDKYAENGKELLKKYGSPENIPAEEIKPKPLSEHTLVYDSASETLEPVYFFILDLMNDFGLSPQKFVDNFTSSPGSGHFGELGQRATIMQQQGMQILGHVNTVLRSVLNIIYDLKEFRVRLQTYHDLDSENKDKRESAILSLKQLWLDKVDVNKANSSIKAMALGQAGFQTLLDAFLMVNNEEDAKKLDLNDRVKRIVIPRISEFNIWMEQSGKELNKRYALERTYLKSQVNSLNLYTRWAKPYLIAASQLESKTEGMGREPALVKVFNTMLLELTLLGKRKLKIDDAASSGDIPPEFTKAKFRKMIKRDYSSCVLVDFRFRGIPQKIQGTQHYSFGGRAQITFQAYALNDQEIAKLDEEFNKANLVDVLKIIEGTTTESLEQLQEEINFFLDEQEDSEIQAATSGDSSNPFLALVGHYEKSPKKPASKYGEKKDEKPKEVGPIRKDDWVETTYIRPLASNGAQDAAFTLFDIYKKSHGMPSYT